MKICKVCKGKGSVPDTKQTWFKSGQKRIPCDKCFGRGKKG